MNPFNFETQYDNYLADLIAKINKASILNISDSIKELLVYLPNSNFKSDYQIILKTLKPLFSSPGKLHINKILYFLAKKLGQQCLNSVIIDWIYENFDSTDAHARYIIENCLDFPLIAMDCLKFLKWNEYLKDLQFYKFILMNTKNTNTPNGELQLVFDVSKLPFATYLELDILFEVLNELKNRNPIEFLKYSSLDYSSEKDNFIESLFNSILNIKSHVLINRKYKILLQVFNFTDNLIYEDAQNLEIDLFMKILEKNLDFDNIKISNLDQLIAILPKITNKNEYITHNINKNMCIFKMIEKIDAFESIIEGNKEKFGEIANESLKRHFIYKVCKDNFSKEFFKEKMQITYDLFQGKNKIIAAFILEKKLDPKEFKINEIEEVMPYSIEVFPVDIFLKQKFNSSACYLLEKYPNLCNKDSIKNVIYNFTKTTPEQIVQYITDIETLIFYLQDLEPAKIKELCKLNTKPLFKIVYLFYLRNEIEEFSVDYSIVLEYFLEKSFLIFLFNRNNNIENFYECCIEYIKNMDIKNTVFYYGYNFDSDKEFYYNLGHGFCYPERNEALSIILSAIQESKNSDITLEVLKNLIQIILYYPCSISKDLRQKLSDSDFIDSLKRKFSFGKNSFILERFLLEFANSQISEIKVSVLEINPLKAVDVLIRNIQIPKEYFTNLNPSYLCNESLKIVIKTILEKDIRPLKLLDSNRIKELEFINTSDSAPSEIDSSDINQKANLNLDENKIQNHIENIEEIKISHQNLDRSGDKNILKREANNINLEIFIEKFLKTDKVNSILDFLYLIERDNILSQKNLRSERLDIYIPLIKAAAEILSESILNLYSISKPEKFQDNDSVFEMLFAQFSNLKYSFWIILFNTIIKTNNLYLCFFIEEMILKCLNNSSKSILEQNKIIPLEQYLKICSPQEYTYFGLAFPNIYSKFKIKHTINLENYMQSIVKMKVDNGKLTYTKSGDFYKIKLVYQADSLMHTAIISIPTNYPFSKSKIEFEKDQKNIKFFHKLNEILNRTSKFVEIFFLWKMDIDNRLIGHTECLICYFIMDPKYKQLPSFQCKTCKNIFHEKCILKWAGQSKRSECPFCRSDLQIWSKDY